MLMPTLSVTAIGLVATAVAALGGRPSWRADAIRGVIGAWLGFVAGGIVGVAIDVVTGGGVFVPVLGHAGAAVGAAWALSLAGLQPPQRFR